MSVAPVNSLLCEARSNERFAAASTFFHLYRTLDGIPSVFEKAFVINLPFKEDRLHRFLENVPQCLGKIEVWPAVHGDTVIHPHWWKSGRGAWGCYRSHLQILEHCYNTGVESYIVFEDDALFRPDFETRLRQILDDLPDDWEQLYLGGQLLHEQTHPPQRITDHLLIPFNVNRTHCFAVHRRGYEALYRHLNETPFQKGEHIDHHLGRLHESRSLKVYCPNIWLVGQDGGPSNISGNTNAATYWVDPEKCVGSERRWENRPIPAVFLESSIEVAIDLERRGWHRGHWQNEQRLDRGVCLAIESSDIQHELQRWYKAVIPEAVREGKACVCLYHPSLAWESVQTLAFAPFIQIQAASAQDAELKLVKQLESLIVPRQAAAAPKRNLIYHIWPRRGNGVWQRNVEQLLRRIDQFDGTRSVGVAISDDADSVSSVQNLFGGERIDHWITVPNNPELGEVTTFGRLLNCIPRNDGSVTFYGHAKGVRYDDPQQTQAWTQMMYEVCLDDPDYVQASLDQFPVSGPFIRTVPWEGGARHKWYFSGSFFWFRNADVFSKPEWQQVRQDYWGSELWPGTLFRRDEAGELFGQECGHLYEPQELARMQKWLTDWRRRGRSNE